MHSSYFISGFGAGNIFDFYAFQSVFFATIYNKYVIHSSYFISGFGAGNKTIVILAMPFYFILRSSHLYY